MSKEIYKGAWITLLAGIISILAFRQFFISTVAIFCALGIGMHTLSMLKNHRKFLKGWVLNIAGIGLGIIGLLIQIIAWIFLSMPLPPIQQ